MSKVKINLDLDNDLVVNDKGKLTVKISPDDSNTLEIRNDGLYAKSTKGVDGSDGSGYEGRKLLEHIMLGYENCFYPLQIESRKVLCTSVVHRIFDAELSEDNGVILKDFRNVDTVLVGDFFRIAKTDGGYSYFIITETSLSKTNNSVIKYEKLGDV